MNIQVIENTLLNPQETNHFKLDKQLSALVMSEDINSNINNIGKLQVLLKKIEDTIEEAKAYNSPKEFGNVDTGEYILEYKQGAKGTIPLSTEKIIRFLSSISPDLVSEFASQIVVTKTNLTKFCAEKKMRTSRR